MSKKSYRIYFNVVSKYLKNIMSIMITALKLAIQVL